MHGTQYSCKDRLVLTFIHLTGFHSSISDIYVKSALKLRGQSQFGESPEPVWGWPWEKMVTGCPVAPDMRVPPLCLGARPEASQVCAHRV